MNPLYLDAHESVEYVAYIAQALAPLVGAEMHASAQLNPDWGDAMMIAWDGTVCQIENKAQGECLSDLDGVRLQLRRELEMGDRLALIIRDVATAEDGQVVTYRMAQTGYWYRQKAYAYSYMRYASWLAHLQSLGVQVYSVATMAEQARMCVELYKRSQNPDALEWPHVNLKVWPKPDPSVGLLTAIEGVGEVVARAWLRELETPDRVFRAPVELLAEVKLDSGKRRAGMAVAMKLVKALGREA